ncbi:MAG: hypothetical protein IMZ54_00575 [Acidobacteria bacterium]|nr:hypothetical protein [Acidobacteriota bacterium]
MIHQLYSNSLTKDERALYKPIEVQVESALIHFSELKITDICFYFYSREFITHKHARFDPSELLPISDSIKRSVRFIVTFAKNIMLLEDIDRYSIICHELQHAVQYQMNRRAYLLSCILRDSGKICRYDIPTEIDADRKAKSALEKVFGSSKLKEFISKFVSSSDINFQLFGNYFDRINTNVAYDLEKEVKISWEKNHMDQRIKAMKKNPKNKDRKMIKYFEIANSQ